MGRDKNQYKNNKRDRHRASACISARASIGGLPTKKKTHQKNHWD